MTTPEAAWNQFSEDLFSFIKSRIGNRDDAADLLQEAFLKLMEKPPANFHNPRGWLFSVVRNLIGDYYRSARTDTSAVEACWPDLPRFEVTETEALVSSWLRPMLADLPQKYADAVRMADFEGAAMNQVAAELNLSVAGAKSRVQRGRKMLSKDLQDCCSFQFDKQGRVNGWKKNAPSERPC